MDKCIAFCEPFNALFTYCGYACLDMSLHLMLIFLVIEYMVETYGYESTADVEL